MPETARAELPASTATCARCRRPRHQHAAFANCPDWQGKYEPMPTAGLAVVRLAHLDVLAFVLDDSDPAGVVVEFCAGARGQFTVPADETAVVCGPSAP
jgi:hypothetical protein